MAVPKFSYQWMSDISRILYPFSSKTILQRFFFGILVCVGLSFLLENGSDLSPPNSAATKECDQQVSILLNSHDSAQLQRAQYIILDLNCDVSRRLPD